MAHGRASRPRTVLASGPSSAPAKGWLDAAIPLSWPTRRAALGIGQPVASVPVAATVPVIVPRRVGVAPPAAGIYGRLLRSAT